MREELVQFVGGFFFLSVFSILQWLGAHYACFGQDGGTSLGHLSWKKSTEGPQWSHLPVVAVPQCVPCVSEAGQMGCPLAPSDIIGQIQSLWFPHLLSGVSGDVKGCRARQQVQGHCSPMVPEEGKWICPLVFFLLSPALYWFSMAHRNNTRIIHLFFHIIKKCAFSPY